MRKLITNRWFLGAIGLIALALLIWFVGEGIAIFDRHPLESALSRLLLIGFFVLLWLGYEAFRIYRAKRANQKLLEGIAEGAEAQDGSAERSKEELAQLRSRFESAAATLKKARFKSKGGGEQYLYELPWYMFIGAPGSGKTTALVNSGLRFPLAESGGAQAIQGVGGTRNCDWWFTDEAVFLDTAGRYTTQESDQKVDSTAWLGFLDLLKRSRPRRPLNGAIITLSVGDLLIQSEAERRHYAAAVKQRVHELYERLGVRFPVYLMVTKTDLLAGFMEFFSDLGREERAQVWGSTFSYRKHSEEGTDFAKLFGDEFSALEKRLNIRLSDRLLQERDVQRRSLLYTFPQQFSLIGPMIADFIDHTFRSTRFDQQAMLRGVYFTSGTQEGTPIDRVLGTLARSFNLERRVLPPMASSGKSFFLTKLLQEVVFPEAGLAGLNEKRERAMKWIVLAAYAGLAVVTVGMIAMWAVSYSKNSALLKEASTKVGALAEKVQKLPPARADDVVEILPVLNELRGLPFGYAEREREAGVSFRFGLFQGDKVGEQAQEAYRGALRDAFLPRFALRLEQQMRGGQNQEILYEALKAYLMLFDDAHLDPQALEDWIVADWGSLLGRGGDDALRKELAGHLRAALERRPVAMRFPRDEDLVKDVRRKLASASLADRIYSRIKLLGGDSAVPPFRISEAAGPAAVQVFVRASGEPLSAPLSGLFTYDGYHKSFRPQADKVAKQMAAEEAWVMGEQASAGARGMREEQIIEEVRRRYLEDYVREWDKLLADIRLKASGSLADAVGYARVLAAPDSPLKKLAVAVAKEVSLGPRDSALKAAAEKAGEGIVDATKKAVGRILGAAQPAAAPTTEQTPEQRVEDHFSKLRQLVTPAAPNGPMPIDSLLNMLNDFYQELSAAEASLRGGGGALPQLQTANRVKAEADRLPPPLQGLVRGLIGATSGQAAQVNEAKLQQAMSGAAALCERVVAKRYPFDKKSATDVPVEDFGEVFRPGGDLDEFFVKNLQAIIDVSGTTWKARPGSEQTTPVSEAAIRQFQNADVIRKAFFRGGARTPSATVDLVLVSTDVGPVTLEYDGDTMKLSPGAGGAVRVKWPSTKPAPSAKMYLANSAGGLVAEGGWAIFRLFDKAAVEKTAGDRIKVNMTIEGKKVGIELRATSIYNPFYLKELEDFKCPGR